MIDPHSLLKPVHICLANLKHFEKNQPIRLSHDALNIFNKPAQGYISFKNVSCYFFTLSRLISLGCPSVRSNREPDGEDIWPWEGVGRQERRSKEDGGRVAERNANSVLAGNKEIGAAFGNVKLEAQASCSGKGKHGSQVRALNCVLGVRNSEQGIAHALLVVQQIHNVYYHWFY